MTAALDGSTGRLAVVEALSGALAISIVKDAMMRRLWYDIRNQALFDETLRPVTSEIEAKLVSVVLHAFAGAGIQHRQGSTCNTRCCTRCLRGMVEI